MSSINKGLGSYLKDEQLHNLFDLSFQSVSLFRYNAHIDLIVFITKNLVVSIGQNKFDNF